MIPIIKIFEIQTDYESRIERELLTEYLTP